MSSVTITIDSVCAKPRMTQADVWKKRPAVLKYRAFADRCRKVAGSKLKNIRPDHLGLAITIEMPKSWSKKKRAEMLGQPHRSRPDVSNILKAVEDSLWKEEDSMIWSVACTKHWGLTNQTVVTVTEL